MVTRAPRLPVRQISEQRLGQPWYRGTTGHGRTPKKFQDERTLLLPTGVPNGLDEAPHSIRYRRQTGQVQRGIAYEDLTPIFPNGFGTSHVILIETQLPFVVLIKRFSGSIGVEGKGEVSAWRDSPRCWTQST